MGLAVLPYMSSILVGREKITDFYNEGLATSRLKKFKIRENTIWNHIYYPVIFESEEKLLKVQKMLNEQDIFPRRYFYPSLNKLPYVLNRKMSVSESTASSIMCLPLYLEMSIDSIRTTINTVINT
jgi:dTDP-4-amino-4,6-dideoxygalactose transaminase